MSIHPFHAGKRVRVAASSRSGPTSTGEFEILGCYAVEGGEPMYLLRNLLNHHERMTPAGELTRSDGE